MGIVRDRRAGENIAVRSQQVTMAELPIQKMQRSLIAKLWEEGFKLCCHPSDVCAHTVTVIVLSVVLSATFSFIVSATRDTT